MNTKEMRIKYQDNIEVIKKLEEMLESADSMGKELINSSLELVKKEQENLVKNMRKNVYSGLNKKDKAIFKEKEPVIDENDDVIYEISDVKIKDVKDDTPLRVINITGDEDKKNDDVTEVLKKDVASEEELKEAKVVFDGKYKLVDKDGKSLYEKNSNDILLDLSFENKKKTQNSVIANMLNNFDFDNGSHLKEKYDAGLMDVNYCFDDLKEDMNENSIKKTKKIAKKEARKNKRVRVFDRSLKRFKRKALFIATAAMMGLGFLADTIGKSINKDQTEDTYNTVPSIESLYEAGESDASYETVEIKDTPMIESIPELDLDQTKENANIETKDNKDVKETTITDSEEEDKKIGSKYKLDSVDLYHASTDETAVGNTSHLEQDHIYETSLIAIVYDNQVVMKLNYTDSMNIDELESICKEKYGDSIKMFLNFNELDKDGNLVTKNVGWALKEQVLNKGKVLTR